SWLLWHPEADEAEAVARRPLEVQEAAAVVELRRPLHLLRLQRTRTRSDTCLAAVRPSILDKLVATRRRPTGFPRTIQQWPRWWRTPGDRRSTLADSATIPTAKAVRTMPARRVCRRITSSSNWKISQAGPEPVGTRESATRRR